MVNNNNLCSRKKS